MNKLYPTTTQAFDNLHQHISSGYKFVYDHVSNSNVFNNNLTREIVFPKTFVKSSFPKPIYNQIINGITSTFIYNVNLFEYPVKIYFALENKPTISCIKKYNKYVQNILTWLYVVNQYAQKSKTGKFSCVNNLTIYIYHTSLTKQINEKNPKIFGENEANTAFTRCCPQDAEIVIFREEEWFKVFIHETFHTFGLDFSATDNTNCRVKMTKIFNVQSDVNLFEAYTECWARIIYCIFGAFFNNNMIMSKTSKQKFLKDVVKYIYEEQLFSMVQMVKILNHMNLTYDMLITDKVNKYYNENTNILAYYIITTILLYNYQDFIHWCVNNNSTLLKFNNIIPNQNKFCQFIEKRYKLPIFIKHVKITEKYVQSIPINNKTKSLRTNLRMTIHDFDLLQ